MIMDKRIELSVVIPVYNSATIFPELYRRLLNTLDSTANSFEIIAVVDGCEDNSVDVIANFCKKDNQLKLVELSRSFGEEAAVTAGIELASGEMVIVMDDDLEDPPEVLPKFIEKAKEGYDVVYGIIKRRKVSALLRATYFLFYRVLNIFTDIKMPTDAGSFCLMKRPVVNALNDMPETNRYIRGMRAWLGFNQIGIEYERDERYAGSSGYNFFKYLKFGFDGIFSFSYKPLHYVTIIGSMVALISIILGARLIILKLMDRVVEVPGWVSLMVVMLFLGGVQIIAIGIVGQYIARVYDETKQRPKFVVKQLIGFDKSA